jgi:hypothetical protein
VHPTLGLSQPPEDGQGVGASMSIALMLVQVRCGGSSTSSWTSTLRPAIPARVTRSATSLMLPGMSASMTRWTALRSAPASISAPSSMSPAIPADASIQACRPGRRAGAVAKSAAVT